MDASGNLFGTAEAGGASGDGTVFEIAKGTTTIKKVASFNGTNGSGPKAGLVFDASGDLYGTTVAGGASGDGTVFEIEKSSPSTIKLLASFNGANGSNPEAGLVLDTTGNLYGTTDAGGISGDGTVFEILKSSPSKIKSLASFNGTNGYRPDADLVLDSTGNLYGTTYGGGASGGGNAFEIGDGTVFEIAKSSPTTIKTLISFDGTHGTNPDAGLVLDSSGNLYGTTSYGGNRTPNDGDGPGTVFEIPKSNPTTIKTLVSFNDNGSNGIYPAADLLIDSAGNLYGTTNGGTLISGTVFEIAKSNPTSILTLCYFENTGALNPSGGMVRDSSGNLYGMTSFGGSGGRGTVFELTPSITLVAPANQTAIVGVSQTFNLGSFTVSGTTAPYKLTINWGDGSSNSVLNMAFHGTIPGAAHTYAKAGTFTATVTVSDSASHTSNKAAFSVTANAATASITLTGPGNQTAVIGVSKSFALGSFTASGTTAPYQVIIDWGDGSVDTVVDMALHGTIPATTHTYAKTGTFAASLRVTDSAAHASKTAAFSVTVTAQT